MSNLLQKISASQADQETKNGGAIDRCKLYASTAVLEGALCMAGFSSSCANFYAVTDYLNKYCQK